MSRTGKCTNFGNCVLAYRGEQVTAPDDNFVCPECRQPLIVPGTSPRRKLIPILILAGTVLAVVLIAVWAIMQIGRINPPKHETPAPEAPASAAPASPAIEVRRAEPVVPPTVSGEASLAEPPTALPAATEPAAASVPANLNLDIQADQNRQVKNEVLKRIDLMPTISSENKDKLYFSVDRARQMGKIVTIPFRFGQRELGPADIAALKDAVHTPRVQKVLNDPTAVLVMLGFADAKGDEQKNLKISAGRADEVFKAMRDKLKIQNVMHAVGMGGSRLFDEKGLEKNRVVEVWVVLP